MAGAEVDRLPAGDSKKYLLPTAAEQLPAAGSNSIVSSTQAHDLR